LILYLIIENCFFFLCINKKMAKSKSRKVGKKSKTPGVKRVKTPAQKEWSALLDKVYQQGKKKNPSYLYKDAMKDASKLKK